MSRIKKNVNLNLQQFLIWNEDKSVNPKTGKSIKKGGPTYLQIEKGWEKLQKTYKYTDEECKEWFSKKDMNPRTKRKIKAGGLVSEKLRTYCEPSEKNIINTIDLAEEKFEDAEEKQSTGIWCKMGICKKTYDIITTLTCGGEYCMMKGCKWNGYFGINLTKLPKNMLKLIGLFSPYFSTTRCCCFCLGHLIFFISFIMSTMVLPLFQPPDVREINKLQRIVDKIEASTNVDATISKVVKSEARSLLLKTIRKEISSGIPAITALFKSILEELKQSDVKKNVYDGLSMLYTFILQMLNIE